MITLVNAPSILGLAPTGVEKLPSALRQAGLVEQLGIKQIKTATPPPYNPRRNPATQMLNPKAIARYSIQLADTVQNIIRAGDFPLVLGGDCSIIIGNMLALRRMGRYGLYFMDGHADFYQPAASPTGQAADMDLALVSGRGPDIVTNLEGLKPLVQDSDIIQFGQRDRELTVTHGSRQINETDIHVFELEQIRQEGLEKSCNAALVALGRQPIQGFWVHIDADVIHDDEMPAVDYRLPGGLRFNEMHTVLRRLMTSGQVVGLELGIYNPALDPDGTIAPKLVALLTDALKEYRIIRHDKAFKH